MTCRGAINQSNPRALPQARVQAAGDDSPSSPAADPIYATELRAAFERAALPISVRYIGSEWWVIWRWRKGWTCSSHPSAASARRAYLRTIDFFFPIESAAPPCADTAAGAA